MIFVPDILNILMPLDKPRLRQLPVQVEVFFDIEIYFYVFFLFFITVVFLGMTILMATETMYMTFIQHACGLFELVSCRLTCALNTNLSGTTLLKTKCKLCTKLLHAFLAHQHCLEFIKIVQYEFSTSYFILCILGVASLSINMFRFFHAIEIHNIVEVISTGLFVFAHFCYTFYINYFGQDLIDQSECFFQQIYSTQWYTAPICAQKLLFIALQRSAKTSKIVIGSLFVASFEGFATLISMSLSYCMVIYSVRT
ncbi:uncharacterized protein LOC109610174 [Camponotus floridanus]|uniref:uncharacterized protein LOC109610174 n=1 Tax=Camponotus floridanus TaxID=104421 RepID=UPI000DC69588|nr:uncharacterized protein LOC109610174 [Camponotus floridanus]XP_025268398.1 uncharacterized protein LOC109610174 [Camponotus floridanus]